MGLRFRKRVKVAPGLTFNLSWSEKRGVTTSSTVGVPGANINVGTKKNGSLGVKHGTLGIPGSGLSYHENLDDSASKKALSVKHNESVAIEEKVSSEDIHEDDKLESDNGSTKEVSWDDYGFVSLHNFAHSRTINWIINFAILGGLFYINR